MVTLRLAASKPSLRLLFVHGFLGSSDDWQSIVQYLPTDWDLYALNLPGHVGNSDPLPSNFSEFTYFIDEQAQALAKDNVPVAFVGYSLGARLLMHLALKLETHTPNTHLNTMIVRGFVLEGGNFGLQQQSDISTRWENDRRWIKRFNEQSLCEVLNDWYQQPVFSSLNAQQRKQLVAQRSINDGKALAQVMSATSLAKQAYLLENLQHSQQQVHYIVGEYDQKFSLLYERNQVSFEVIEKAGHNTHKEQPEKYAKKLTQLLSIVSTDSL
ncbi:2-succinyl-6-hydroxy-2,4-cyclohexadiene-1-carboxylate synthase [Vibrio sp. UCD-FRSSP16_10]|nr:2-succinyl-6-hydroxy-2,4-cyclohexadiene-1-carboxylate synthase [Vibrio sp. UCD-FRSSP16_30]OBT21143.1 2-succinyl-6-hydroxy-2,4-cyclohexadiene-1-carboxylate synthase [Vibrio sp. UCD-FRSSP16_10]